MDWQTLFLSAEGRIDRPKFWIGALILMAAWIVSNALHVLAPLVWLLLVYPWVCVIAKRLHDFGKSGWLILIPVTVGLVALTLALIFGGFGIFGAIWAAATEGTEPASWTVMLGALGVMLAFLCIAGLVKLIFLVWVGATPGDPGPNRFGPPPSPAPAPPTVTGA